MKPLAIIGVDPGTTSAYLALGLDGSVIKTNSGKELTLAMMISQIIEVCLPIIVSTDKAKVPSFVEEFARKVGANIVHPTEDLLREEKKGLISKYNLNYLNAHQQDCLAAAVSAYRQQQSKLYRIRQYITQNKLEQEELTFTKIALLEDFSFQMIQEVLKGESPMEKTIQKVLIEERITRKDFTSLYQVLKETEQEREQLQRRVDQLQEEKSKLRKENNSLRKRSEDIDLRVNKLFRFKEERIKIQDGEIRRLHHQLKDLNKSIGEWRSFVADSQGFILAKKVASLTKEEFEMQASRLNIQENEYILVENPTLYSESVIAFIKQKGITLLSQKKIPAILEQECTVISLPDKQWKENESFSLIPPEVLERSMEKKDLLNKVLQQYHHERNRA